MHLQVPSFTFLHIFAKRKKKKRKKKTETISSISQIFFVCSSSFYFVVSFNFCFNFFFLILLGTNAYAPFPPTPLLCYRRATACTCDYMVLSEWICAQTKVMYAREKGEGRKTSESFVLGRFNLISTNWTEVAHSSYRSCVSRVPDSDANRNDRNIVYTFDRVCVCVCVCM